MTSKAQIYGKTGKFGTSALVSPDIAPADLGEFLSTVEDELAEDERFKLPRTIVLSQT